MWEYGHCPACAEAERIVAFLRKEADDAAQYEWPEQHAILRVADFIEDGEHARGET